MFAVEGGLGMRSAIALVVPGVLLASLTPFPAPPAQAACHIAAFTQADYPVGETAGSVTVTVFLQGPDNTCTGSVVYATADGTATAPQDYTATQGTLCFLAGDEQKTFGVPIVDDNAFEGDERFTVQLSDADQPGCQPDNITAGGGDSATVTIASEDPEPAPPAPAPTPTRAPQPTPTRVPESPTPSPEATPPSSPTTSPTPSPTPSPSPPADEDGGAPILLILGLAAAALAAGAFGVWWYLRSRAA